jgi:tetratricopeptide (TPR) repeat protein
MNAKPNARKTLHPVLAAAVALALPSLALAQGQIDAGRANDASNRVGAFGRNDFGVGQSYYSNTVVNNGNRIVTGNVTQGREFRGNVGYSDPYAFRGPTAGIVSDTFAKNSVGVPRAGAPPIAPNTSVPFYGAAQTVAPPPGFQLNASKTGYVPPATVGGTARPLQDQRIGIVDLNQPISPTPTPGDIMMRGTLNPQQAAQQAGILTGSTLYGVREWNPQDPADRSFLQNVLNRQNNGFGPQIDPRQVQRMRDEVERALLPDRVDTQRLGQDQQQQPNAGRAQDSLTLDPIRRSFESPNDPALANRPIDDQVQARPLGASGVNTEQGMRYNLLGRARRTSEQYTELNKRLDQYYTERRKSDADFAREFNADVARKKQADAKTADARNGKLAGADATNPANPPGGPDAGKKPGGPNAPGADADKPKVARPQPVKVATLSAGVRGEGLANVMKKAEALMKEGKYTSALDQYDAAEAVTPNNPLITLGRGHAELGAGFYVRADGHLRQALTTDRALLMGQYDLTAMLGEERLTRLVTELKEQTTKEPGKSTPLFLLAYIAYNTGHEQQALGYLDLAEQRGGDQGGFFKLLKEHWALPDAGNEPAKPDAAAAPKPELNK